MKKLIAVLFVMFLCINGTNTICNAMEKNKVNDNEIQSHAKATEREGYLTFFDYWEILDKIIYSKDDSGFNLDEIKRDIKKVDKRMKNFRNMREKLNKMESLEYNEEDFEKDKRFKKVVKKANEAFSKYIDVARDYKSRDKLEKFTIKKDEKELKFIEKWKEKLEKDKEESEIEGEICNKLECPDYRMYKFEQ